MCLLARVFRVSCEWGGRWSQRLGQQGYAGALRNKDLYARILNITAPWPVADVELNEQEG